MYLRRVSLIMCRQLFPRALLGTAVSSLVVVPFYKLALSWLLSLDPVRAVAVLLYQPLIFAVPEFDKTGNIIIAYYVAWILIEEQRELLRLFWKQCTECNQRELNVGTVCCHSSSPSSLWVLSALCLWDLIYCPITYAELSHSIGNQSSKCSAAA